MVQTIFLYPEAKQAHPGEGTVPDTRTPAAVRAGERGWEKGRGKRGRKTSENEDRERELGIRIQELELLKNKPMHDKSTHFAHKIARHKDDS